ncbi:MAG: peptide/nickel transport system substrate-binding protein [Actinomycetota bacterium]|nr:peptide/nickel transport system substrate-binding protein [Actinomycetota bacterium]
MRTTGSRRLRLLAIAGTATLLGTGLAACGDSSGSGEGDTFVFGASAEPKLLDGAFVSDGESLRIVRQIFEGLVTTAPGKTDVRPQLAKSWTTSADGRTWTFLLHEGVSFSDGTPMDAKAVCANFDRWYHFTGVRQSPSVSYYWTTVFGGFAQNEDASLPKSLYSSCTATGGLTAVIKLARPSAAFLSALTLPAFSIASPAALKKYKADEVSGAAGSPRFTGTFGTEHPVGTGPYLLRSWERGNQLVLERNETYWGNKAKTKNVVFKAIPDGGARLQSLQSGGIDGYDLVDPADVKTLKDKGFQLLDRPAFNVGYVGLNQSTPLLKNPKVRQAIIHAIDRERLVKNNYPEGTLVAKAFMPPGVFGYADDVPEYQYDPARAKELLTQAGVTSPKIEFWYPTDVSRPYLPDPAAVFQLVKGDLEKAGFTVTTKSAPWTPEYLDVVQSGKAQMYLLGWAADYGDPDNFIGTFFQKSMPEWGFNNPELTALLDRAEALTNRDRRIEAYQEANRKIMEFVPGVPFVHTQQALAFRTEVQGFVPSPVQNEDFATVSLSTK